MASFSNQVIEYAKQSEEKYGVPASVTLAQYALESGWGKSGHAKNHNNYFGMTGSNNGKFYMSGGRKWQEFNSMAESFDAHGKLLSGSIYAPLTKNATTVREYVSAIAETYAPSSDGNENYTGKIMSIINDYNLTQYDSGKWKDKNATITETVANGVGTTTTTATVSGGSWWSGILSWIVKACAIIGVSVLAFILIMQAFNIEIKSPKKLVADKVKEKAGGEGSAEND